MADIKGIIPAMVTPLDDQEELDEAKLRRLVNFLIEGGVHGLFPIGSQGEFYAFSPEEKRRVLEVVVEEAAGRVPVYAGTGAITTRQVIELNKVAEQAGVDAVSVLTPFFINPSETELYEHFVAIAEATSLPVLLYNNPGRTGVKLSVGLVARLAEHPNIVGIKDSSGDLTLTIEMVRQTGDDFAVLMGRDSLIYAGLQHGIKGAIAATANVVPGLVVEIYQAFMEGDMARSLAAQEKLLPLRLAFDLGTFPVVVKDAMNMIGVPVGPARRPLTSLTGTARDKLREILEQVGAL
ncbi:MAG: 4-hydroxy-tetrahydrodipicolinate synthase [Anaerolineae bacterium]